MRTEIPIFCIAATVLWGMGIAGCDRSGAGSAGYTTAAAPGATSAVPPLTGWGTAGDPLQIPYAPALALDAGPDAWATVPDLPVPMTERPSGMVKLAWNEQGLHGLAVVKVKQIKVDPAVPWTGDCLELFIEKDARRSTVVTANAVQYALAPGPGNTAGSCLILAPQNGNSSDVTAVWQPTGEGYVLKFFIPADKLRPAAMRPGSKLGLNYSIDNEGKPIEQFFNDKQANEGYRNPSTWGVVVLRP